MQARATPDVSGAIRTHQRECLKLVELRAVLHQTKKNLIETTQQATQAQDEIAKWKRKTQAFFLGQPKTKRKYKAKWANAALAFRDASDTRTRLQTRLVKHNQQYARQLQTTAGALVRLSANFADYGEHAAQICIREFAKNC